MKLKQSVARSEMYWNLGLALCFAILAFIMTRRDDGDLFFVFIAAVCSVVCVAFAVASACELCRKEPES